jgi:hypothetical protein
MSLEGPQAKLAEAKNDAVQVTAEHPSSAPTAVVYSDLLGFWLTRPTLPPAQVTEQAFQTLHRIFEANCAVTRAFCDLAERQQSLVLATTEATLSGLPAAVARHVDRVLASAEDAYGQNLRMLGTWSSTMLVMPRQALMAAPPPAAS